MNCTQCGVVLTTEARFCPGCGGAIAPTEPASQSSAMRAASAAMIGREIAGRYRILEKLGEAGMRAAAENIASGFGGTVELKRIQGNDVYTGIYDMTEGMRMEVVLYPGSGYVLAVAFGTLFGEFDASASARHDLFENRVRLP